MYEGVREKMEKGKKLEEMREDGWEGGGGVENRNLKLNQNAI